MTSTVSNRVFVVHHNPNSGRYRYPVDPTDAIASAKALVAAGEGTWVAGNCRRMIRAGDLLLFKFGGARLKQPVGIYAAARVTRSAIRDHRGVWVLRYAPDGRLTQRLLRKPIEGKALVSVTKRSFGASIQTVEPRRYPILGRLLGDARLLPQDQGAREQITHGLLILKEPLDKILAGRKTWEIRGKRTMRRGPIALIESKSGHVVGTCEVIDVVGPLTLAELRRNRDRAGFHPSRLRYATTYAWVVQRPRRLPVPVPYRHPSGAVIWVRLARGVLLKVCDARPI